MKPTKDQIKPYYSHALQRCLEAFARLDDKSWGKKVASDWTARECLAHLVIAQEEQHNVLIEDALAGRNNHLEGYDHREQISEYNERQLAKVRDLPTSQLLERLKAAYERSFSMLDAATEADLDKPAKSPGWDRPGTVRDLFFSSYLHLPGHYQDIRRAAKKELPHWMESGSPEEVHFQLDRIFHFMPLTFWSSRGADMRATYAFEMDGPGGGQWTIMIGDGKAEAADGAPGEFDLQVRTKPELWIDLTTNDLNAMWAITTRKVQLGGNASLAMKLSSLFQVSD